MSIKIKMSSKPSTSKDKGWKLVIDPATKTVFYRNTKTNETSNKLPTKSTQNYMKPTIKQTLNIKPNPTTKPVSKPKPKPKSTIVQTSTPTEKIYMGLSWQDPSSKSPSSKKSSVNSGQKLPNDVLGVIASKANAITKATLKASSKFLKNEVTVVRPPRVINYNYYKTGKITNSNSNSNSNSNANSANSSNSVVLRKILEKYKNKDIIEGDFVQDPDQYRHYGSYFFVINKKGEKDLLNPELHGNGEASVPAWVLEKGMENGHSLEYLLNVYSWGRFRYAFIPEANIPKSIKKTMKKGDTYVFNFDYDRFEVIDEDEIDL
jgi:hypothetical protein